MKQKTAQQGFLRGAAILTAGVFLVKLLGALFKIPLNWIIGEDGMGYYTTAYSFYAPVYSLATAGFPVAVSRLTALCCSQKRYGEIRRIHQVSIPLFLAAGLLGMMVLVSGSGLFARAMGNENALPAMLLLAPSVVFSCLSASYRGCYEGMRNMIPTAVSEILEALFRLVLGLSAAWWVLYAGMEEYRLSGTVFGQAAASLSQARAQALPWAAAGAIGGVTAGSAVSFLYLLFRYRRRGEGLGRKLPEVSQKPRSRRAIAWELLRMAAPVGLGAVAVNLSGLVDAAFLQSRIMGLLAEQKLALLAQYQGMIPAYQLENSETIPNFLFGCYGNAHTLFMVIPAVAQAFGISALPNVTAAWSSGKKQRLEKSMESVLRMTAAFCLPAGLGMAVMAGPLTAALYGNRSATPIVAGLLPLLAGAAVCASVSTALQSMLQAVGRADLPVKLLSAALVLKTLLSWYLTGLPEWNIRGAALGTLACYLFMMTGGFLLLKRCTGVRVFSGNVLVRPLAASAVCCTAALCCQRMLELAQVQSRLATVGAVACAAAVYGLCVPVFGILRREDLIRLPGGQKIGKLLAKREKIE